MRNRVKERKKEREGEREGRYQRMVGKSDFYAKCAVTGGL